MPTIFQRIPKGLKLTQDQKIELGKKIADYYTNHKEDFPFPLKYKQQIEPEGEFTVLRYPKQFGDKLDELISHYIKTVAREKRKRTPLKSAQ